MYRVGIDVGSTFTKYCILEMDSRQTKLFMERTPVRQKEHFAERLARLRAQYSDCRVISCGYGRKNTGADRTISELTALAAGAACQCPEISVILDIGGQDTKVVRHENGKLKAFFVNEKCAAGCGIFLGNALHMLNVNFDELDLTGVTAPGVRLSSVCAVFAQTEIVELLAGGTSDRDILQGVIAQIFLQAKALLDKVDCQTIALSGGLTQIPGLKKYAENLLGKQVFIPENGPYLSAIGCVVIE